jgi:hypothetical protein
MVRHGMSYPAIRRAQAYRVVPRAITRLAGAGEEEFSVWVKARAKCWGWNGWHIRDSEGVIESIHSLRYDGFSEAMGIPDWHWWHEDFGQSFWTELKGSSGYLSKYQKREIPSMQRGGLTVFVWYPRDAPMIERIFHYGLEGQQ